MNNRGMSNIHKNDLHSENSVEPGLVDSDASLVFDGENKKKIFKNLFKSKKIVALSLVIFLTGAVFASVKLVQMYVNFRSNATLGQSDFFFTPATSTLTNTTPAEIKVFTTTTNPVAFIKTEITFDHNLIQLVEDPILTSTSFSRRIRWTSAAQANSTGKISLVVGMDPTNRDSAPSGSFEIAKLKFIAKSSTSGSLTLSFDVNNMQAVTSSSQETAKSARTSTLTLNPASPVPSPIVSPSPTQSSPSPTPAMSSSPKASSIATPTPSPSPTLAPSPTTFSCSACFKGVCDGVCSRGKDKASCSDCR